ncbi:MAG: HK97 family phage prohead protease [Planctomycetota bacterium]
MPRLLKNLGQAMGLIKAAAPDETGESVARFVSTGTIDITAAEGEGDKRKLPTFAINAYGGGEMMVGGFYHPVVIDLSGLKASRAKLPILLDHDPGRIIGMAEKVEITDKGVSLSGKITGEDDDAKKVVTNAKNGFEWQASVGARVLKREFLEAGSKDTVNGRDVSGPLIIARQSELVETSFVAIGADQSTSAAVAATNTETPTMTFEQWLKAQGIDPNTISNAAKATLKASYDAEHGSSGDQANEGNNATAQTPATVQASSQATSTETIDIVAQQRQQAANEQDRIAMIQAACQEAGGPQIEIEESGNKSKVDLAAHAIRQGWDRDKVELEVLRASRASAPAVQSGATNAPSAQVIEASLSLAGGIDEKTVSESLPQSQREEVMNAAMESRNRGATLHSLMDAVILAAGQHFSGSRKSNDFIRAAFEANQVLQASAGGFSTISLTGILSNVANKALIAAYNAVEVAWPQVAGVRNHNDFKVHTRYRMDSEGSFRKVGPDGELKSIGLTEASYTNKVDTFGAIVALNRQQIINDDLGAFLELQAMLGRLSAIRKEEAVFVLLLSNPSSFFSTGNKNYFSGASTSLSIDSLTTGKQMFKDFVDSNGKPILVSPDRLLVPSTLEVTANSLYKEQGIIAGTSTAKQPKNNPHAGLFKPVVSPYLNNTAITDQDGQTITGQSNTGWYLLSNPAIRAAVAIAFLNGKQTPTIESAQTSFDTLGMQWRAFDDFGVGTEETTAAVNSKGAA